jgi:hypothetical protein
MTGHASDVSSRPEAWKPPRLPQPSATAKPRCADGDDLHPGPRVLRRFGKCRQAWATDASRGISAYRWCMQACAGSARRSPRGDSDGRCASRPAGQPIWLVKPHIFRTEMSYSSHNGKYLCRRCSSPDRRDQIAQCHKNVIRGVILLTRLSPPAEPHSFNRKRRSIHI